ncbi:MAG: hypothetical protein A2Y38_02120 [Spirochaetes bacterium GWB1_59_5]|nr:MAG: hypothetical protein A2Y38_02120 [Spirochaetes bacterium GWB1_59_5]
MGATEVVTVSNQRQTGVSFSEKAHQESDARAKDLFRRLINEDGFHPPAQRFFREQLDIEWVQEGTPFGIDFQCYGHVGHFPLWELDVKHKKSWEQDDRDFPWSDVQVEPRSTRHLGSRMLFVYFSLNWKRACIIPPEAFTGETREVPNARQDTAEFPLADARKCWFFSLDPAGEVQLGPERLRGEWRKPDDLTGL